MSEVFFLLPLQVSGGREWPGRNLESLIDLRYFALRDVPFPSTPQLLSWFE